VSVRHGKVLSGHGSVLHRFAAQIAAGSTHSFISIPDADQLEFATSLIGEDTEVFVPDLGDLARLADVAQKLVKQSGPGIVRLFTGLRPGQKSGDDPRATREEDIHPSHALVSRVAVGPLCSPGLARPYLWGSSADVRSELWRLTAACVPASAVYAARAPQYMHVDSAKEAVV
jgi:hypothetical protein